MFHCRIRAMVPANMMAKNACDNRCDNRRDNRRVNLLLTMALNLPLFVVILALGRGEYVQRYVAFYQSTENCISELAFDSGAGWVRIPSG